MLLYRGRSPLVSSNRNEILYQTNLSSIKRQPEIGATTFTLATINASAKLLHSLTRRVRNRWVVAVVVLNENKKREFIRKPTISTRWNQWLTSSSHGFPDWIGLNWIRFDLKSDSTESR